MSFFSGFNMGGMGGMDDDDDDKADTQRYYDILGINKKASQSEIKKSFLELAKKHHPDKGGNAEKFAEIKQAYETLNDPEKREIYDRFGEKGLNGGRGGGDPHDILNMFFGGGGRGGSRPKQMPKVKPTKKKLDVTLEEAYNGCIKKIPVKRSRCCQTCKGKGGNNVKTCTSCKGRGVTVKVIQMGPMIQQVQQHCPTCKGEGNIMEEKDKCKTCKGQKVIEKEKTLEVSVEKGICDQQTIVLSGEGDELPDCLAGDVVFFVAVQKHDTFTRVGADLFIKHNVSLVEALTGFDLYIKHLDNQMHHISLMKNQVVSDTEKKVVRGLGMPFYKDSMNYGNLIVEIDVKMPQRGTLTPQQIEGLCKVFDLKPHPRPANDNYEMMVDFDIHNTNTSEEGGHKEPEEEEQEGYGGQRVQCASH